MTPGALSFARAKIQQPRLRVEQIPRPALERRLERALEERSLVLLSAPAGYGKTVLLSRVLGEPRHGRAVAWVSADEDDDLQRLVQALVTALEPYDLPWRASPEALGALAAKNHRLAADSLLEALASAELERGIIVLEDGHRLRDAVVFQWLDKVLDQLPPTWCVALTSRVDPPLALARLRVREELEEFRAEELRFSLNEAQALAAQDGGPAPAAVEALWQRTHGWPVGLYLALQTGHAAPADQRADRHAFDYLASEVLAQMPEPLRLFLLRCSLLPELTAAQCAAVSGDAGASAHLAEIERSGLFATTLDSSERALRLHDLFREFLEHQLLLHHREELPELLHRAAASEPDPVRRVGYLLRAGDYASAQQALAEAAPALLLEGADGQLLRLVDTFPTQVRVASPVLALIRGMQAWPRFRWHTMLRSTHQAVAGFEALGMTDRAQQARIFECLAAIALGRLDQGRALREQVLAGPTDSPETRVMVVLLAYWLDGLGGPAEAPAQRLNQMLDLLLELPSPQLWFRCAPHYVFLGRPGVATAMERFARHAAALAGEEHVRLAMAARIQTLWALFWRGQVDEAERLLRDIRADERWLGHTTPTRISLLAFDCILQILRGSHSGCRAAGEAIVAEVDGDEERKLTGRSLYVFQAGRISAAVGDWDTVRARLEELATQPTDCEWPFMRAGRPNLAASLALHEDAPERAVALIEPVLEVSAQCDLFSCDAMLRATLAAAHARLGRLDEAWAALAPVVEAARASGETMGLLMTGTQRIEELAGIDWGGRIDAATRQWLDAILAISRGLLATEQAPGGADDELSPREREVLALIAAGDSNKLIARALDLSPHTVKRHVANILGKLNLATRGQAAAWWHAHGQD